MADEWIESTLGEVCTFIAGSAFPKDFQGERVGTFPFIKVSDMNLTGNERWITRANNWISQAILETLHAKVHPKDATIFAKIGVALTTNRRRLLQIPTIIDNNMMSAVPRSDVIDSLFFYYLLCTLDFNQIVCGTALPYLNINDLQRIPISYPPPQQQQAIACILGALDDKIENNRRMNETLEAMARAIFKSWFVDFAPVHAKAASRKLIGVDAATAKLFPDSFVDSPVGRIPKGWKVSSFSTAIEVNPDRTLPKGVVAPYLDMKNMPTSGHRPLSWIERPHGSGMRFMNGDTLVARITPCLENGKTAFVNFLSEGQVGWGSTEYIVIHPKSPLPVEYGYYLARSEEFRAFVISNMTGTSGRQRTPATSLNHYELVVPTGEVAAKFGGFVRPLMRQITACDEQSRTLAALRDALLPKLLSGEIRVKDAEMFIEKGT